MIREHAIRHGRIICPHHFLQLPLAPLIAKRGSPVNLRPYWPAIDHRPPRIVFFVRARQIHQLTACLLSVDRRPAAPAVAVAAHSTEAPPHRIARRQWLRPTSLLAARASVDIS